MVLDNEKPINLKQVISKLNTIKRKAPFKTMISIDDSVLLLSVALGGILMLDDDLTKNIFLLDIVDSYQFQLNKKNNEKKS